MSNEVTSEQQFVPVVNEGGHYSLWPAEKSLPPGWQVAGHQGTKEEVLEYIEDTWVDIRPIGVRTCQE